MKRREFTRFTAAWLSGWKLRIEAAEADRNIHWAVSSFLWTSTQWKDAEKGRFTEMLDVIKDVGLDGFRLNGWPQTLERYGMPPDVLEKELAKRGLRLATLSFGGEVSDAAQQAAVEARAHEACRFLRRFGSNLLTVFSPRRPNKVLVREHLRVACGFWTKLAELSASYGIKAGLHNHSQGQLVESQDEVERAMKLTEASRFGWSPDTVHLYLGGCDIPYLFEKYARRLVSMDFVDAKYVYAGKDVVTANGRVEKAGAQNTTFLLCNQDLGDGEIDFPRLMRVLKRVRFQGWITIDHHHTPVSPRHSFNRCRDYIARRLDPIYR